jgi:hypothetical protein
VKHTPRLFKKLIEKQMEELRLPYKVFPRGTTEEGTPIIYVINPNRDGVNLMGDIDS